MASVFRPGLALRLLAWIVFSPWRPSSFGGSDPDGLAQFQPASAL
jgi:hypothetical protein